MPHDAHPAGTTRKVFRQASANITGWIFIGLLALATVLYVIRQPSIWYQPVCLCGAIGLIVWVVLVRPSVVVAKEGVEIHNLVRDIDLPWEDIDLATRRWNLKVYTPDGRKFGSWAISQQRPQRESGSVPGAFGMATGPEVQGGIPRSLRRGKVDTRLKDREASADAVAALIEDTKLEYDDLVASGDLKTTGKKATVAPAMDAIAAVGLAVVLGVICLRFFT